MPNYIEYHQSIAAEFKAYENRVRNLIDNHHWPEEGRYKEIILINYLRRVLPNCVSVGTGFVKSKKGLTKQIDIIIYKNAYPTLFAEGDFVILTPESVVGIIEVKSRIDSGTKLKNYIKKANKNADIIFGDSFKPLFNGIFSYNCDLTENALYDSLNSIKYNSVLKKQHFNQPYSNRLLNCVNHIALSQDLFIKLWPTGRSGGLNDPCYSAYDMPSSLAFAYFISNLLDFVLKYLSGEYVEEISEELNEFLYPLPEGKEACRLFDVILTENRNN